MTTLKVDQTLECEGLACPMPVVKTKKAIEALNTGEVLEVKATDKGSVADLQIWTKRTGHQYIGLKEEAGVFHHYIRKVDSSEINEDAKFPHTTSLEDIRTKLASGEELNILDVREPVEYAFGRLPRAVSIPAGELETRLHELDPDTEYYVICRTGSRSDLVCRTLTDKGFLKVKNVIPGMTKWTGDVEQDI